MSRLHAQYEANTDFIQQIKATIRIEEPIGETVPLKRSGSGFRALCPFLGDTAPSLSVSADRGLWFCHGCGKGGDVICWVMERDKVPFGEALEILARRGGIEFPHMTGEQRVALQAARTKEDILTATAFYYHSQLNPETRARIREAAAGLTRPLTSS